MARLAASFSTLLAAISAADIRRLAKPTLFLHVASATLSVFFLCVFCPTAHAGATITVSAPAAGTTVNCVVTVTAMVNFTPPDQQADSPIFYFTDNLGHQTHLTGNPVYWNSMQANNGTVSIYATVPYHEGYYVYTANSAVITVTVKNGCVMSTDTAKTYAKVTAPTNGQSIVANGQSFVVTSDHQITWTSYDGCGDYGFNFVFKQTCTYPGVSNIVVSGYYHLPPQPGDWPKTLTLGLGNSYLSGGATPSTYYVYALCYTPDQNSQVAQGNSNFTMVPIPKQ